MPWPTCGPLATSQGVVLLPSLVLGQEEGRVSAAQEGRRVSQWGAGSAILSPLHAAQTVVAVAARPAAVATAFLAYDAPGRGACRWRLGLGGPAGHCGGTGPHPGLPRVRRHLLH